jgi:hypothetical protein
MMDDYEALELPVALMACREVSVQSTRWDALNAKTQRQTPFFWRNILSLLLSVSLITAGRSISNGLKS